MRHLFLHSLALILLAGPAILSAADLDSAEQEMAKFIDDTNASAMELLIETININSGTMNFPGVRAVAEKLIPEFSALGFNARFRDGAAWNRAGHLIAEHHVEGAEPKLLLIGHLDTVFEPDSPFQEYEELGGGVARGPGISDMKGGNIIMFRHSGHWLPWANWRTWILP